MTEEHSTVNPTYKNWEEFKLKMLKIQIGRNSPAFAGASSMLERFLYTDMGRGHTKGSRYDHWHRFTAILPGFT